MLVGSAAIYHPMNVLPYDVRCCLRNSLLLIRLIVPPVIQYPFTIFMGCEHGFLGTHTLNFQSSLFNCLWYMFASPENLNWIEEISVIMSWLQVIRKIMVVTIKTRHSLALIGPKFCDKLFLTSYISLNMVIGAIHINMQAESDNLGWL